MGTTVRLDIEYDGSQFRGWARQPHGVRTVQGELESALQTVLGERVELSVAGRTDTGVHALGQVASFRAGGELPGDLARRLNGVIPTDLAISAAAAVAKSFDARADATSRTYLYRVLARQAPSPLQRGRALWWPYSFDRDALEACAAVLPGTHDFTAFTPTQSEHVRFERDLLAASWEWHGPLAIFRVSADAFMRNMVRVLVGTMLEIACGRRGLADFTRLLEGAPRPAAGETSPAHGLYLESVSYERGAR